MGFLPYKEIIFFLFSSSSWEEDFCVVPLIYARKREEIINAAVHNEDFVTEKEINSSF